MNINVGDRVIVTASTCFGLRTRIVEIVTASLGGTLYVMANGQRLTANEFRLEGQ